MRKKTIEQSVLEYQAGDKGKYAEIAGNMNGLIKKLANRGVIGLSFEDLHSELSLVLWKCCDDWNGSGKLTTMFYTYSLNKIRELRESAMRQNRVANVVASSYEQMQEGGFDIRHREEGFSEVELWDLVDRLELTPAQYQYVQIELGGECGTKRAIAAKMGVDPSSINYFQSCIGKKLSSLTI